MKNCHSKMADKLTLYFQYHFCSGNVKIKDEPNPKRNC